MQRSDHQISHWFGGISARLWWFLMFSDFNVVGITCSWRTGNQSSQCASSSSSSSSIINHSLNWSLINTGNQLNTLDLCDAVQVRQPGSSKNGAAGWIKKGRNIQWLHWRWFGVKRGRHWFQWTIIYYHYMIIYIYILHYITILDIPSFRIKRRIWGVYTADKPILESSWTEGVKDMDASTWLPLVPKVIFTTKTPAIGNM